MLFIHPVRNSPRDQIVSKEFPVEIENNIVTVQNDFENINILWMWRSAGLVDVSSPNISFFWDTDQLYYNSYGAFVTQEKSIEFASNPDFDWIIASPVIGEVNPIRAFKATLAPSRRIKRSEIGFYQVSIRNEKIFEFTIPLNNEPDKDFVELLERLSGLNNFAVLPSGRITKFVDTEYPYLQPAFIRNMAVTRFRGFEAFQGVYAHGVSGQITFGEVSFVHDITVEQTICNTPPPVQINSIWTINGNVVLIDNKVIIAPENINEGITA